MIFSGNGEGISSTAEDSLKRHIDYCLELDAYFIGVGDYIDFPSPSGRRALLSATMHESSFETIAAHALELTQQVYDKFLKPCTGRFVGLIEGHHYFEAGGQTTDQILAHNLKTRFLGTSAYIEIPVAGITVYAHHGMGGGLLPGIGLNKLYHLASGLPRADFYLMGHNTKLATTRLSRPYPIWGKRDSEHRLSHSDIWLVNCGGFSRSSIVGNRIGGIPRGDYAERGMMTPSPLSAPLITVDIKGNRKWVAI